MNPAETGLYYLQSRYYDPALGRFISKDDQSYHDGMTGAAANLYAYANNNPPINIDFDGRSVCNINRVIFYWWGLRVYLNNTNCNKIVAGLGISATLATLIPNKTLNKVLSVALGLQTGHIAWVNAAGRGVCFDVSYIAMNSIIVELAYINRTMKSQ